MQNLQQILSPVVPAWAGAWQPTGTETTPPAQFCVYSENVSETYWGDDEPVAYALTATIKMWSTTDPQTTAAAVRTAMQNAGWTLNSESTGGAYDSGAHRYGVNWTYSRMDVVG